MLQVDIENVAIGLGNALVRLWWEDPPWEADVWQTLLIDLPKASPTLFPCSEKLCASLNAGPFLSPREEILIGLTSEQYSHGCMVQSWSRGQRESWLFVFLEILKIKKKHGRKLLFL